MGFIIDNVVCWVIVTIGELFGGCGFCRKQRGDGGHGGALRLGWRLIN